MSRGKFKIAKFSLGDDEIDYRLYNAEFDDDTGYLPALMNAKMFEAFKNKKSGIEFGLNSYDDSILYLNDEELTVLEGRDLHAMIEHLPVLVKNTKTTYAPTLRNDRYYLSVNNETSNLIYENLPNFKFLESNGFDKIKIVIESGISNSGVGLIPTKQNRIKLIIEKFLMDEDFLIQADNRIVSNVVGMQKSSQFENYASGEKIINFSTELRPASAVSLDSGFDYFATFLLKGIQNLMFDYAIVTAETTSANFSNLGGPRGSILAFNVKTDQQLQVNSTGDRDSRFVEFGTLDNVLFSEMPTRKFDYIDTTIYITGATTNSSLQIPLRIIRYAGL